MKYTYDVAGTESVLVAVFIGAGVVYGYFVAGTSQEARMLENALSLNRWRPYSDSSMWEM